MQSLSVLWLKFFAHVTHCTQTIWFILFQKLAQLMMRCFV